MKLTPRARNTLAFWSLQAVLVAVVVAWMASPVEPRVRRLDVTPSATTPTVTDPLQAQRAARDEARRLGQQASLTATQPGLALESMTTSVEAWHALAPLGGERADADLAGVLPEVYAGLLQANAAWLSAPTFEHELPSDAARSPDGELLAVADAGGVTLYDVDTGAVTARLPHAAEASAGVLWSADGERLVTFSQHRLDFPFIAARDWPEPTLTRIWTRRGRIVAELSEAGLTGSGAALSDAGLLVVGGERGQAHLYDVTTGAHLTTLEGHRGEVDFVAIADDGSRIVTVSRDARGGEVRTWGADGELQTRQILDRPFDRAAISGDTTRIATWNTPREGHGGDELAVWRLTGRKAGLEDVIESDTRIHAAAFSPTGDALAWAAWNQLTVHVTIGDGQWDRAFGTTVRDDDALTTVAWSTTSRDVFAAGTDGRVRRFDGFDGRALEVREGHRDSVTHIDLADDGTLVSIGQDDRVRLWPAAPLDTLPAGISLDLSAGPVALSRHGSLLVQAVSHGDELTGITVVSRLRGTTLARYQVAVDAPVGIALRPGPQVHVLDERGRRHVFDALSGDPLSELAAPSLQATWGEIGTSGLTRRARRAELDRMLGEDAHAWSSASKDGRWIAFWYHRAETAVELWDRTTGHLVARLDRHATTPEQVLFSPDGTTVATVENDGTTRLWALPSGQPLATWRGTWQGREAPVAQFTQHGRGLVVGDRLIYPLQPVDLVDTACTALRHAPSADVAAVHATCR